MNNRRVLSIVLENHAGALSRVAGLFSARGYNIRSVTVAPTETEGVSRMTIVTDADDAKIEQITKQLNRLVEVLKVVDLMESDYVERDLMLVKVRAIGRERDELLRLVDIFRGHIVDVAEKSFVIEVTGNCGKLDAFLRALDKTAILETVRAGTCGIARGDRVLKA